MSTPTASTPRIVPIRGSKGGTGRTTAVVHLAAALARQGRRVAVMDTTALGDTTEWIQDARAALPAGAELPFELLEAAGRAVPATSAEIVLVDTDGTGQTFSRIQPILDLAAVALIPLQPSRIEVSALWATVDVRDALHPRLPVLALLSRANPATVIYREVRTLLAEEAVPTLTTSIPERVKYADAVGTVPEASPAWDAAAAELARCLFPPAREPVRRTSFDLPASTHARLRWAKHTTGKPMGQLIAEVVDAAYPEPIPTARSRTS